MKPRIAIVGAGALGAHVGGFLTRSGQDVTLIDPWPEHVERLRGEGLSVSGLTAPETFTVPVKALHITELQQVSRQGPFDIAFVAMKSYDTVWATALIQQYLAEGGFVVSLQNCINEERIAGVVGWGRTVGCIASMISVELFAPGRVRRHVGLGGEAHTVFRVGEVHGRVTPRVRLLVEMLAAVDSAKVTQNLWGERWTKLSVNAMRNPVAAATGRGGNANDHDPRTRWLAIRLAGEAVRVGVAHGYTIEKVYGIDTAKLLAALDGDAAARDACETALLNTATTRTDEQRPSMGQDMAKGRRTETDYMNGLVVAKAAELGIPVPANAAIVEAVKRVERGETRPRPDAVSHI